MLISGEDMIIYLKRIISNLYLQAVASLLPTVENRAKIAIEIVKRQNEYEEYQIRKR